MKPFTLTSPYPLVLIGNLRNNNHNSFISIPSKESITFAISKASKDFRIIQKDIEIILNFNSTQTLSPLYSAYKKSLEFFFTQVYQVENFPCLRITTDSQLDKYSFGALLASTLQALSQFYLLKLNNEKLVEVLITIFNHLKNPPPDFFVQTLTALLRKPFYFHNENPLYQDLPAGRQGGNQATSRGVLGYQLLDLTPFHFDFYDLNQKLNSQIFPDFSQDKLYREDIAQINDRISFLASQSQKAIFQKAPLQLGENLLKNQKALNQLGFNHEPTHRLIVDLSLSGAYGAKVVSFLGKLYLGVVGGKDFNTNFKKLSLYSG